MTSADRLTLLAGYLASAHRIAIRLTRSIERLAPLFPLQARSVLDLSATEEERIDAFLHRFSSLAGALQDHVGRALLLAEEEDLSEATRKDQRLLLEKFGALDSGLSFGFIAELRNKLVHTYPDDPGKQADVLNQVYVRSHDLLSCLDGMVGYSSRKFGVGSALAPLAQGTPPATP